MNLTRFVGARANTLAVVEPGGMLLSIVRTAERERSMHFVGPIFNTRVTAFALKGKLAEWPRQNTDQTLPSKRSAMATSSKSTASGYRHTKCRSMRPCRISKHSLEWLG